MGALARDWSVRIDFRDRCFASTQCKVFDVEETWSLLPFCGRSKCVQLKSKRLAEEVEDCGPVIDLQATIGCQLVPEGSPQGANKTAPFPDCCPVYDCEEGTEVVYVNAPETKKTASQEQQDASIGSAAVISTGDVPNACFFAREDI